MKQLSKLFAGVSLLFFLLLIWFSCQKEIDRRGEQQVKIYLTDDPVPFDAVYVDIQGVEVLVMPDSCRSHDDDDDDEQDEHGDDGSDGHDDDDDEDEDEDREHCAIWDTLDIRPGVYNLLELSNGADTLLASGFTVAGTIKKIRITLGNNNSVVVDSVSYPLSLYEGRNSIIIKVKGDDVNELAQGTLEMWLDFDAGASIIRISDNHFVLKPCIKIFVPSRTAAIKGHVLPDEAHALVAAIALGDTLVAIPDDDEDGYFKIRGIRGSTADLFINATANGYLDTTLTGVSIAPGRVTDVGVIRLRQ